MKYFITFLTILLVSTIGLGQNSEFAKLDSFFITLEQNDRFYGSVSVSQNGKILYSNAIGFADRERNIQNNNETKFRIGSITKTFTATLIMQAVEMNKISLDDKIKQFFPRIQNADKISIRHLLNHRSGINSFTDRNFLSWYTQPISQSALFDTIINKGVDFEPNAKHVYSNSNYVLLTFILENVFQQSYAELIEQRITGPLGLVGTSYGGRINSGENEAKSYRMQSEWVLEPEGDMSIPLGAGGVISTTKDLCLFSEALFGGQLISNESVEQMHPVEDEEYGFALYELAIGDTKGIGHGGAIDAFTSTLIYNKENNLSLAVSCNGSNFGKHDVARAVLAEILGQPYDLPNFDFVELSSNDLDQYLGTYETDELPMDFTITKAENELFLKATGQPASQLSAEGDHQFSIMKYGVKVIFYPSEKRMHFEQQGMAFELTLKRESEPVEVNNVDLEQFIGTYESDLLPMDLTIIKKGNQLMGQGNGQPAFPLQHDEDYIFTNPQIGLKITFEPGNKKLHFVQGGSSTLR